MLTKWFDEEIITRQVKPDTNGNFTFSILKIDFLAVCGKKTIDTYFKKIMKLYGYTIRLRRKLVEITKLRQ